MKIRGLALFGLMAFALCISSLHASPITPPFTQCPGVGLNTSCEFLLVVNPDMSVSVLEDTTAPNNGPYDGSEDTLVGVLNTASSSIGSLPLSSTATIFGFDGDGPCTQSPAPASCPSSAGFDSTGYGGPGVTFTITDAMNGTVNFTGGLAPGASAWFGLEEALSASLITPGTPGPSSGVPEPATFALLGGGLAVIALLRRKSA